MRDESLVKGHDVRMTTYIALLRGVNVGGNNKVPMAVLRSALEADGFANVRTYIQSGNVLVDATRSSTDKVAARVKAVINTAFGLDIATMVLDVAALERVARDNPYSDESDPRRVHAIFLPGVPDADAEARLKAMQEAVVLKGSSDTFTLIGSTLYLHTPDGFGTSDLAKALSTKRSNEQLNGTGRNWATVTTLLEMART